MEQIPIGGERRDEDRGNVVELPTTPFSSPPDEEPHEEPPAEDRSLGGLSAIEGDESSPSDEFLPGSSWAELDELVEQGMRVAIGMASVAATAVSNALERTMPRDAQGGTPVAGSALAGATVGLGIETARLLARSVSTAAGSLAPLLSFATSAQGLRERAAPITRGIDRFNDVWSEARPEHEAAATAFVAELLPRLVDGIVEQLDLTALVADRIDLDAIVDRIDLDAVVDRIDIDEIVRRVDLDVAVGRIDLVGITDKLIGEVDLPELIRESTGAVTSETVRNVRLLSAEVDRRLAYVVDRVLMRNRERAAEGTSVDDPDASDPPEDPSA
jgi:hypothetical protein